MELKNSTSSEFEALLSFECVKGRWSLSTSILSYHPFLSSEKTNFNAVSFQLNEWKSWKRPWRRKMKTWNKWRRDTRNTWKKPRVWVHLTTGELFPRFHWNGSVRFGTVRLETVPLDLACTSTSDHTFTWWAGHMQEPYVLCYRSAPRRHSRSTTLYTICTICVCMTNKSSSSQNLFKFSYWQLRWADEFMA